MAKNLIDQARGNPNVLDDLLNDPGTRSQLLDRQANFWAFADGFTRRERLGWTDSVDVPGFGEISLLGLNTALLSNDDNDQGHLVVSGEQRHSLSTVGQDAKVHLLLSHHPLTDGWLHDEATLRRAAESHHSIHLCGHVHDPEVELTSKAGGSHHVRVVAAAAHRDPKEAKKVSHGYNFASLMVDPQGQVQIRTWPRRWFPKWESFRVDHLGVPDRRFYDDKPLGIPHTGSGLVIHDGVHWWGDPPVQWKELLRDKRSLDVFGIAMATLFDQPNCDYVKDLLEHDGKVRVVLADPFHKTGMARYDEDFDKPLGDRTKKVIGVLKLLYDLQKRLSNPAALEVWLTRCTFKYSAYRIDGDVLFVPYRTAPGKNTRDIPALLFDARSQVTERFLEPDLDKLLTDARKLERDDLSKIVLLSP